MITNRYIIDTSSLIELNRHNPRDIYPGVWSKLEALIRSHRLLAPKEVFNEVKVSDDSLATWAKAQGNLFVEPTARQIEIVKEILSKYPDLLKADRKYDADAWVIALAIEMAMGHQKTISPVKRIVVTEEKLRGNRIRIPFVCEGYQIETIDILDMFRNEGWKF